MNPSDKNKIHCQPVAQNILLFAILLVIASLSACTPVSQVSQVTQIIAVTQVIPITQIIPVTQIVPITEIVQVTQTNPSPQITPIVYTLTVSADQDWQTSRIPLSPQDQIVVAYVSGTWSFNIRGGDQYYVDPNGYLLSYVSSLDGKCGQPPLPDAPKGALVARIGYGPAFLVGSYYSFIPDRSGDLWFRINDDCMGDDSGQIIIEITITPK